VTIAPVAPLLCAGHPNAGYKATTLGGVLVIYCPTCAAVIDRRTLHTDRPCD
jgi:hypothetical protein